MLKASPGVRVVMVAAVVGAAVLVASSSASAAASAPPRYDIAKSCQAAKAFATGRQRARGYRSCLAQERKAKHDLAGAWSRFPTRNRRECDVGGPDPSYVELQTCLRMSTFKSHGGANGPRIGGPLAKGLVPAK